MEYAIEVSGLKKSFKDVKAVDDISFRVEKGELFGFLGINGAGKSTTINMLCTLLPPAGGEARICGHMLGAEDEKIRRRIGVVWQGNCLDKKLTVKENLYVRGSLYGQGKRELRESVERICEKLGLEELLGRRYDHLSGGQKRRCEIAAALVNTPEVLFLDEPTTGLDPATRQAVWNSLEEMRAKEGVTIFLTTHYMEEAAKANHIAVIDSGKIRETGTPFALKERFARDKLKLIPRPGRAEELEAVLRRREGRSETESGRREEGRIGEESRIEAEGRGKVEDRIEEGSRIGEESNSEVEGRSKIGGMRGVEDRIEDENRSNEGIGAAVWKGGYFLVTLPGSMSALPILKAAENCLQGFELVQGSMDDVFLNITGKTLEKAEGRF